MEAVVVDQGANRRVEDMLNGAAKKIFTPLIVSMVSIAVVQFVAFSHRQGETDQIITNHESRIGKVETAINDLTKQNERLVRLEVRGEITEKSIQEVKVLLMNINERMLAEEKQ
jgi:hypothetical protein